jgi:hypothetical protein
MDLLLKRNASKYHYIDAKFKNGRIYGAHKNQSVDSTLRKSCTLALAASLGMYLLRQYRFLNNYLESR